MDIQLEEGEISDCSEEDGGLNNYKSIERPVVHYDSSNHSYENETPAIEEDGIEPYIPLERPYVPVTHYEPMNSRIENDAPAMELDPTSSGANKPPGLKNSDSESEDEDINAKRMKLCPTVKSKYNIWNKDPDGDLTDFLNQVGMDEMPDPRNSRNVENYPLPFKLNDDKTNCKFARQRRRKIPYRRDDSIESRHSTKKVSRNLDSLDVNESNTIEEVAEDITNKLMEKNQDLILRIVVVLGKHKAMQMYEKTRAVEKLGGVLINNGSRKRTSGGVFIFLIRSDKDIPEDKLKAIFEYEVQQQKKVRNLLKNLKKKRKKKKTKSSAMEKNPLELSNPPPSPDVPDQSPREDTLNFLLTED